VAKTESKERHEVVMYYDSYTARGNDLNELSTLARQRGFTNPGPIVAFPPNGKVFARDASPAALRPNVQILVPWRPDLLRKLIATMEHLASEVANDARELIEGTEMSNKKLEQFLIMVDAICMLASIGKGVGDLVVHGVKHGEMTAAQLVSWVLNSRLDVANNIATLSIPAPSEPKKDFKFFVRHTLGPWTPSFWASVVTAIKTRDMNIYLYGPAAIEWQTKMRIKNQADADIRRMLVKVQDAKQQLAMPFYNVRI
jgi:hypothetical protein